MKFVFANFQEGNFGFKQPPTKMTSLHQQNWNVNRYKETYRNNMKEHTWDCKKQVR